MREIKFRIWDGDGYVREGWYIGNKIYAMRNCQSLDPNEEVLEQFTGLHDKNGNEIYENDILKVGYTIKNDSGDVEWDEATLHKVKWYGDDGYPAFDLVDSDCDMNGLAYIFQFGEQECEVIGNIHENPDLLN